MTTAEKIFNVIVMFIVMLTGGLFGAYIGSFYKGFNWSGMNFDQSFIWTGMTAGVVSAYPLAKLYLRRISEALSKGESKANVWSAGTFRAGFYGVICTVAIHGVMIVFTCFKGTGDLGLGLIALSVGVFVGAVAGTVVGGICSLVYVLVIKSEHRTQSINNNQEGDL